MNKQEKAGRPKISGNSVRDKNIIVRVNDFELIKIKEIAKRENKSISDILRKQIYLLDIYSVIEFYKDQLKRAFSKDLYSKADEYRLINILTYLDFCYKESNNLFETIKNFKREIREDLKKGCLNKRKLMDKVSKSYYIDDYFEEEFPIDEYNIPEEE